MLSQRKVSKRSAGASNAFEDVERIAHLVMHEAQMSLPQAGRILGKLIAVYVLGVTLSSNCCLSWYLVPVGVVTLAMAVGWSDAIGKECKSQRFFPYKTLNSVGASLFRWQWFAFWGCLLFTLSCIGAVNFLRFDWTERLVKVSVMAIVPLALMLLGRAFECGSAFQFQQKRGDIQKAEALVRQLATTRKAADHGATTPLIEHEKIPLYKLGSVAKILHDIVDSYDTAAKLRADLAQSQRSMPKGAVQQMLSWVYAPFRAMSSDLFLWERRDVVLYIVTALYIAMVYVGSFYVTSNVGAFFLPLCVLVPFLGFSSKAGRYVRALQENIRSAQGASPSAPTSPIPSISEIRAAVPPECFERSSIRSLLLVLRDGIIIASFATVATCLLRVPGNSSGPLSVFDCFGWAVYAFWQGTAFTGWWVLAHECGHGAFSSITALNNIVGYVLHTFLLVPYFSWQYSHAKHHSKTNHLVDGESHVPELEDDLEDIGFVVLYRLMGKLGAAIWQLVSHLVFGWPAYLLFYATGGRRLKGKAVSKPITFAADHFRPNSMLFPPEWQGRIAMSTVGVLLVLAGLVWASRTYGLGAVVVYYFLPYLWCNFWLVLYTWLQHTDPNIPHYGESDWTWVKGALCTIDRPYGIFDWFHHRIGSTHVCHHLFSKIPCYHAKKATEHLKAFLEPRGCYNYDPTPWPLAAWRVANTCHFVEGLEGTQYFKSFEQMKGVVKAKAQEQEFDPNLWYIHGHAYDLSQFVNKHPGGAFTLLSARGRDCTGLFESYHPWNDNNRKVLAAYGPKPPPCDLFYEEMKVEIRKLFPRGKYETKMRPFTVCCLLAIWVTYMYLFFVVKTAWSCLFAGVLVALFATRITHEGGHMQASHKPWFNRMMLFIGYLPVGPSLCWYYRHVISHHVHTNDDHDVDVKYIALLDIMPTSLRWVKVVALPFIFMGAVLEIGVKQMFDLLVYKDVAGCPVYYDVGGLIPEAIFWMALHATCGPSLLGYACMWLASGAIFVPMSQVAHAILYPDPSEDDSWAKAQLKSSVNFAARSSFWYHAAFGLTTQIEHHLFPGIGAHCLDDIHDKVVKPICAKHNVPVYDVSARKALYALWLRLLTGKPAKVL